MKKTVLCVALAAAAVTTPAQAQVPWAVEQFLNGIFASMIYNAATASTPDFPVYKVGISNGVFWVGDNSAVVLKKTTGVDSVRYTFSKLPLSDDGTGNFVPVGEITVAASTPVQLSQYASEPGLYKVDATMLSSGSPRGAQKKIEFMTLTKPAVSLQPLENSVTSTKAPSPLSSSVAVQSDIEPTKVTMAIGDTGKAVLATKDPQSGIYTANLTPLPGQAGPYPIYTTTYFNKASQLSISSANSVTVISPPKITLVSAPRLLDATYGDATNSISIKIKNTSPESTLPSTNPDGSKNFLVDWYVMGNFVSTKQPDEPFDFKFGAVDYAAMKAAGLKKLPITAVAYHQSSKPLTASSATYGIDTVAPWSMPEWSLQKAQATPILVPNVSRVTLVPSSTYDLAASKKHKLKLQWSLPDTPDFVSKANGTTVNFKVSKPGSYPISVVVTDDAGAVKTYTSTIEAAKPTLNVDTVSLVANPVSKRVPVTLTPRIATSSTHPAERITGYEILLDGVIRHTGSGIKPVTIDSAGEHLVTVKAISNFGNVAEGSASFSAVENQAPVCKEFRLTSINNRDGSTSGVSIGTQCADPDGRIKSYTWSVNGDPEMGTNSSRSYGFSGCETQVTVSSFAKDDSGAVTEHTETIPRKVMPLACK